ncbi:MAG TPA: acyltransferase family protein, partial [Gemmatimonadaceae bacterium]|nr:acyltransferase family protein [Gemmatimonadaceae bacterium]
MQSYHPTRPATRIPSLDGLRAASIALVLVGHVMLRFSVSPDRWVRFVASSLSLGHLGVMVFFVISGFLITTLLLTEIETTGRVSLRYFYFRRTLRIFPAYYAFLMVLGLLSALGWLVMPARHLLTAALYTTDYVPTPWTLGHTWSLAV